MEIRQECAKIAHRVRRFKWDFHSKNIFSLDSKNIAQIVFISLLLFIFKSLNVDLAEYPSDRDTCNQLCGKPYEIHSEIPIRVLKQDVEGSK